MRSGERLPYITDRIPDNSGYLLIMKINGKVCFFEGFIAFFPGETTHLQQTGPAWTVILFMVDFCIMALPVVEFSRKG